MNIQFFCYIENEQIVTFHGTVFLIKRLLTLQLGTIVLDFVNYHKRHHWVQIFVELLV